MLSTTGRPHPRCSPTTFLPGAERRPRCGAPHPLPRAPTTCPSCVSSHWGLGLPGTVAQLSAIRGAPWTGGSAGDKHLVICVVTFPEGNIPDGMKPTRLDGFTVSCESGAQPQHAH